LREWIIDGTTERIDGKLLYFNLLPSTLLIPLEAKVFVLYRQYHWLSDDVIVGDQLMFTPDEHMGTRWLALQTHFVRARQQQEVFVSGDSTLRRVDNSSFMPLLKSDDFVPRCWGNLAHWLNVSIVRREKANARLKGLLAICRQRELAAKRFIAFC
jgi:hypothetical protein